MCWVCNPMCGGCQPPRKKMVLCPECGYFTMVDLQVTSTPKLWTCEQCGHDISADSIPVPRYCMRFDVDCANPCGYRFKPFVTSNQGTCQFHTDLLPGQAAVPEDPPAYAA